MPFLPPVLASFRAVTCRRQHLRPVSGCRARSFATGFRSAGTVRYPCRSFRCHPRRERRIVVAFSYRHVLIPCCLKISRCQIAASGTVRYRCGNQGCAGRGWYLCQSRPISNRDATCRDRTHPPGSAPSRCTRRRASGGSPLRVAAGSSDVAALTWANPDPAGPIHHLNGAGKQLTALCSSVRCSRRRARAWKAWQGAIPSPGGSDTVPWHRPRYRAGWRAATDPRPAPGDPQG